MVLISRTELNAPFAIRLFCHLCKLNPNSRMNFGLPVYPKKKWPCWASSIPLSNRICSMTKSITTLFSVLVTTFAHAQLAFPSFLEGTWQVEGKEQYETWSLLNSSTLKGVSYGLKSGVPTIAEYLDLNINGKNTTYTATVLGQNEGKGVVFSMTRNDSVVVFENPMHDFPKRIEYRKLNENQLFVSVSDGGQKGFSFPLRRMGRKNLDAKAANPNFDPLLAEKLGADGYGMKPYFLVLLKTGNNPGTDKAAMTEAFKGHLDNITRLVDEQKMVVAGPLGTNDKTYRGIFILQNVANIDEAKVLLQTDPAIHQNYLEAEVYNWYGSAALPAYLPYSDRIWKTKP